MVPLENFIFRCRCTKLTLTKKNSKVSSSFFLHKKRKEFVSLSIAIGIQFSHLAYKKNLAIFCYSDILLQQRRKKEEKKTIIGVRML